jgi:chemotaxis response regulator CheB
MSVDGLETAKDTVQVLTESAASHIGRIAVIITGAVRDVARELGDWATDAFEMRDAAKRAQSDQN